VDAIATGKGGNPLVPPTGTVWPAAPGVTRAAPPGSGSHIVRSAIVKRWRAREHPRLALRRLFAAASCWLRSSFLPEAMRANGNCQTTKTHERGAEHRGQSIQERGAPRVARRAVPEVARVEEFEQARPGAAVILPWCPGPFWALGAGFYPPGPLAASWDCRNTDLT